MRDSESRHANEIKCQFADAFGETTVASARDPNHMRFFTGLQTEVSFPDGAKRTLLIIEAERLQEYIDIAPNIIDGRVYCSAKRTKAGGLVCFEAC